MKTKGEDKIIKVEINEKEIGKDIEYKGNKIHFKKGSETGDTFKIKGKGHKSKSGGENGDLIYIIGKITTERKKLNKRKKLFILIIFLVSRIEGIIIVGINRNISYTLIDGLAGGIIIFSITITIFYIVYLLTPNKKEGSSTGLTISLILNILFTFWLYFFNHYFKT